MEIVKGHLIIEGTPYQRRIHPPSTGQILSITNKQMQLLAKVQLKYSATVKEQGRDFITIALGATCLKDVQNAYTYLCKKYASATHIT